MSIIFVSGTCFLNFFSSLCVFQSVKIFHFNISSRLYRKYHVFIKNRSIFCTGFVKFFQENLSSLYSFGQDQDLFIQLQRLSQTKFFSIVYILVIPLLCSDPRDFFSILLNAIEYFLEGKEFILFVDFLITSYGFRQRVLDFPSLFSTDFKRNILFFSSRIFCSIIIIIIIIIIYYY